MDNGFAILIGVIVMIASGLIASALNHEIEIDENEEELKRVNRVRRRYGREPYER